MCVCVRSEGIANSEHVHFVDFNWKITAHLSQRPFDLHFETVASRKRLSFYENLRLKRINFNCLCEFSILYENIADISLMNNYHFFFVVHWPVMGCDRGRARR